MKEIEVELTDEMFLKLSKEAHKLDITFNQLCNKILKEKIKENA